MWMLVCTQENGRFHWTKVQYLDVSTGRNYVQDLKKNLTNCVLLGAL